MDADTLRLILIVAGGFLLIGLYFWERKRARSDDDESLDEESYDEDKREPQLGAWPDGEQGGGPDGMRGAGEAQTASASEQPELELEPPPGPLDGAVSEGPKSPLILSLHLTPLGGDFDGESIVHAASRCGVEPGEMDIFHRYADPKIPMNPLFSMANMVKPGTFPFGAMAEFESPGLTLFSQAEGAADDPERLETMFATARCLAFELNAEIRDGARELLTPEVEARLRDKVLELVAWRLSEPLPE